MVIPCAGDMRIANEKYQEYQELSNDLKIKNELFKSGNMDTD